MTYYPLVHKNLASPQHVPARIDSPVGDMTFSTDTKSHGFERDALHMKASKAPLTTLLPRNRGMAKQLPKQKTRHMTLESFRRQFRRLAIRSGDRRQVLNWRESPESHDRKLSSPQDNSSLSDIGSDVTLRQLRANHRIWIDDILISLRERSITVLSLRDSSICWAAPRYQDISHCALGHGLGRLVRHCLVRLEWVTSHIDVDRSPDLTTALVRQGRHKLVASCFRDSFFPIELLETYTKFSETALPFLGEQNKSSGGLVKYGSVERALHQRASGVVNFEDTAKQSGLSTPTQLRVSQRLLQECVALIGGALADQPDSWLQYDDPFISPTVIKTTLCANSLLARSRALGFEGSGDGLLLSSRESHSLPKQIIFNSPSEAPQYPQTTFKVHWNFHDFMHTQYGSECPPVRSVLVLTGSVLRAQATTCGDYVMTNWPRTGALFLDLLETILKEVNPGDTTTAKQIEHDAVTVRLTPSADEDPLAITVITDDQAIQKELTQQLKWIGCALSASPFKDAEGCEVAYAIPMVQRSATIIEQSVEISYLHKRLQPGEQACWLPLFSGAVIASGFPIPARGDEVGLEISLDILAALGGVRHAVEYDGGIILKGFSTMFVPTRKIKDRVQWHAIVSKKHRHRLTYHDGLHSCETRAKLSDVSFNDLGSTRAFLGWTSVATTRLGSDDIMYENLDYSDAKEPRRQIKIIKGQLGLQQIGAGMFEVELGAKDGRFHHHRTTGPYSIILDAAESTHVVLYDTQTSRAWLVPATDAMLHMVRSHHEYKRFMVDGHVAVLKTTVPAGKSAKDVLLRDGDVVLINDKKPWTLRDKVLDTWSLLDHITEQELTRKSNGGIEVKDTWHTTIFGYEYKAVVLNRGPFHPKRRDLKSTSGGWPRLIRDIDAIVLLADGFGDLIVPAVNEKDKLCSRWKRVPEGQDYLATTVQVLKELQDVAHSRLDLKFLSDAGLQWDQGQSLLFEPCLDPQQCHCSRVQQVTDSHLGTPKPPQKMEEHGAAIFGKAELPARLQRRAHEVADTSPFYKLGNEALQPRVIVSDSNGSLIPPDGTDSITSESPASNASILHDRGYESSVSFNAAGSTANSSQTSLNSQHPATPNPSNPDDAPDSGTDNESLASDETIRPLERRVGTRELDLMDMGSHLGPSTAPGLSQHAVSDVVLELAASTSPSMAQVSTQEAAPDEAADIAPVSPVAHTTASVVNTLHISAFQQIGPSHSLRRKKKSANLHAQS